jgi:hypothetical protein
MQVNSLDNDGMLEGRWTSEYPDDCTKPTSWTGSVAIVKEFMDTKEPANMLSLIFIMFHS